MLPIFFPLLTLTKRFSLRIGEIRNVFAYSSPCRDRAARYGAPLHTAARGKRRRDRTARVPQVGRPDDSLPDAHVVFSAPEEEAACIVKVQGGHIMDVENARTLAMQVGTVIATRRKKMGLTQVQLATRLGITQDSLSRMENGAIAPKFSRLPELAASLDCAVVDLFRQPTRQTRIMADAVADELSSLPPEMQALVLRMVRDTSRTLRKLSKK